MYFIKRCACISVKTKYSDNVHNHKHRTKEVSTKQTKEHLGIIYEDIEYTSDNYKN